jgi:hypothetical protein
MPANEWNRLLLIVTGSDLRAEEMDRPLAYYLKQKLEEQLASIPAEDRAEVDGLLVVADFRWLHEDALQRYPTISVGGPGVNALARQWLEEIPITLAVNEQIYVQIDTDAGRASVWGMDNAETQAAVGVFLERYGRRFLDRSRDILAESRLDLGGTESEEEENEPED